MILLTNRLTYHPLIHWFKLREIFPVDEKTHISRTIALVGDNDVAGRNIDMLNTS